jgi:predicted ATPase/serine phosphatase RsbU (regulator of sigma subunit)/tRNA A-37 threonylcarbamoyl transferase component Bud32
MTFPGYLIVNQIYESIHSLVYRAIKKENNQPVILKLLKQDYPSPEELMRYQQEYDITRRLGHLEGVIKAYSIEKHYNTLLICLEDFGGQSLKDCLTECSFNLSELLTLAIKASDILGQVHQENIIHKDINPSNFVFNPNTGVLKMIDFGISTQLSRQHLSLKNPNVLEGTLAYLSPEQTGRMNRALDYRTDFYALGMSLYELFTHRLPFESDDPMEWVHCHLAKQPPPPNQFNSELPPVISELIMKLLEKTAEARYQSAWGIKADLQTCFLALHEKGKIVSFTLAQQDISNKFQLPQKLYGREQDIVRLLSAFDRASEGQSEMMLVAGYSGIGKSALVHEIYKPITEKRGYFIAGKFDQLQRNVPYSAVVSAFQDLVRQLLTENQTQLKQWQEKILKALGANGQVIIDVIPEIEVIIGAQPEVPTLAPSAAQNRFNLVFQNLIEVFCQPTHPLVIFLDDLQWIDSASLKLMAFMMAQSQYLFLIGAYRDNEVDATHPLMFALTDLQKANLSIETLNLSPLNFSEVNQFIADTLNNTLEKTASLAQLVQTKTGGNPFFMGEFLKTLYTEKLLNFDFQEGRWEWHLSEIQARNITDNVVELMAEKVDKLGEKTQEVLKIAACIGNPFHLSLITSTQNSLRQNELMLTNDKNRLMLKDDIVAVQQAVAECLIIPVGDEQLITSEGHLNKEYKFVHDRIQQAVYSRIPEEERQRLHWQIGHNLLHNIPQAEQEQKIFTIVDQLNVGIELIESLAKSRSQVDPISLAQFNLIAGRKAKASAAYQAAFNYLTIGITLLEQSHWQREYELILALHVEAAESAYLSGNFEPMEALLQVVLQYAKTLLDTVKVYEIRIQSYITQNKMLEAVEIGLHVLNLLEVSLPKNPNQLQIILGLLQTKITLGRKRIEDLGDLPEMTDPYPLAAMRIISSIDTAAYIAVPKIFPLLVFKQIYLSVKYGNTVVSAYAYATYGLILCGVVGDIEVGHQFGKLALALLERFNIKEFKPKILYAVNNFIRHWKEHPKDTLSSMLMAYQSGLETGDMQFAAYAVMAHPITSYLTGQQLATVEKDLMADFNAEIMRQLEEGAGLHLRQIYGQLFLNLMGKNDDPCSLSGERCDEKTVLPLYLDSNNLNALAYFYYNKLTLYYLFQDYPQAIEAANKTEKYLNGIIGFMLVPLFYFYDSLVRLALYSSLSKADKKRFLKKVQANQKKIKKWAHHAPMNYQHKFKLVEAERHRILGQYKEAREYYDEAIALAHEQEYLNEEALANELAGQFYLSRSQNSLANFYLHEAHYGYSRWGAVAKAKNLEKRYPQYFTKNASSSNQHVTMMAKLNSGEESGNALDFASVFKASQAIASEIELKWLLEKLIIIMIENAGAERGCLILDKNGQWVIEAEATIGGKITVLHSIPVMPSQYEGGESSGREKEEEGWILVPSTLINYVAHAKESVILHDASNEGQFRRDSYIAQNQIKSALCAPLLNQAQLVGMLYLENNLTEGAFTPDRLKVLSVLSSQAVVSLENAMLYRTLEEKVKKRTAQLAEANEEITALNEQLKSENLRMSAELKVSRQLQQMLLPKDEELQHIQTLEIAGSSDPADEVGGDYYDVLNRQGRILIGMGDVTGHGLESGVLAIMAQTAVRTLLANNETDPVKFMTAINETIYENVQRMNCGKSLSLILLDYQPVKLPLLHYETGGILRLSGQHEELIVVRNGEIELIDTLDFGFPVGMVDEIAEYIAQTTIILNSGDLAVLYTDGITEAENLDKEEYGLERLCEVIKVNCQKSPEEIRQRVIEDVQQYIGQQKVFDDITLLVLKQK